MSALGAFLRGVGGPGLIDQAQYMRRQQEIDQARMERQRELDESRKWREEQAAADREARAARSGGGGGGGSRGGALADAAGAEAVDPLERQAVFREMQDTGVSMAEAQQRVADAKSGTNRFTRTTQVAEQIDDGDRMRTVTREQTEPDVESFKAMMKRLGRSLAGATSDLKSNADQLAGGRQTDAVTAAGMSGDLARERGALIVQGKGLYDAGGSSVLTGVPAAGSVDAAKIPAEGALARQRNAAAAKTGAEINKLKADAGGNIKASSPERLTTTLNAINGLIRTFDEDSMDDATRAQRTELQQMARGIAAELNRRGLGNTAPATAPGPAKPASTLKALPPGAKQIGTSKGKPVYETPDGKRFIGG